MSASIPELQVTIVAEHPQAGVIAEIDWCRWFSQWGQQISLTGSPINVYELTLKLTTDADIQTLNHTFRQIDRPTDVLSFAALETDYPIVEDALAEEPLYLGDIIVSLDTAERQAQTDNHSLTQELVWLAAHGFLHLLGWDHPDDDSLQRMLYKQQELLASIGLPPPIQTSV